MLQLLIEAIRNRQQLEFTYSNIVRVAHPTAVGISSAGNEVLRCYQIEGGHVTPGHAWDLCRIELISNLRLTGHRFDTDPPGYKAGDGGMIRIFAQL